MKIKKLLSATIILTGLMHSIYASQNNKLVDDTSIISSQQKVQNIRDSDLLKTIPHELVALSLENLDLKDVVRFSMTSKANQELVRKNVSTITINGDNCNLEKFYEVTFKSRNYIVTQRDDLNNSKFLKQVSSMADFTKNLKNLTHIRFFNADWKDKYVNNLDQHEKMYALLAIKLVDALPELKKFTMSVIYEFKNLDNEETINELKKLDNDLNNHQAVSVINYLKNCPNDKRQYYDLGKLAYHYPNRHIVIAPPIDDKFNFHNMSDKSLNTYLIDIYKAYKELKSNK